jgi:hypothetical protein
MSLVAADQILTEEIHASCREINVGLLLNKVAMGKFSNSSGTALARTSSNSKLQTRPLIRGGAIK